MTAVRVTGKLIGHELDPGSGDVVGEIVHVERSMRVGPAENAFVYVQLDADQRPRGRYVAWINLYDIEHAAEVQPGRWQLVQPAQLYDRRVSWSPYGWGGKRLPSIADA